jgi:hypothetical protein
MQWRVRCGGPSSGRAVSPHAELVLVEADHVVRQPANVSRLAFRGARRVPSQRVPATTSGTAVPSVSTRLPREGAPAPRRGPAAYTRGSGAPRRGPAAYTRRAGAPRRGPAGYTRGSGAPRRGPAGYTRGSGAPHVSMGLVIKGSRAPRDLERSSKKSSRTISRAFRKARPARFPKIAIDAATINKGDDGARCAAGELHHDTRHEHPTR